MKIKLLSILLLITILILSSCSVLGNTKTDTDASLSEQLGAKYSKGLEYEVSTSNPNQCIITGIGTCTDKNINIPMSIDGKTVVGIADNAFSPKTVQEAKSSGVKSLASSGKKSAVSLANEITIVTTMGNESTDQALAVDTTEITSVSIPLTVKTIGEEAFLGCTELETISTSQGIQSIGKDAFKDTAYYNNEDNWDGQALYLQNCLITVSESFQGEFTVKEGTTLIADQAFYQCTYVTYVNVADSVTSVGNYAFYGCTSLTYVNTTGEGIQYGTSVFEGCFSYKDLFPGVDFDKIPTKPSEEHTSGYHEINEEIFESARKPEFKEVSITTRVNENEQVISYIINEHGFYYTQEFEGTLLKELYGMTDENGTTIYMRKDGKWYNTTATQPNAREYYFPMELHFDMLTMYDEEKFLYAYIIDDDDTNRIEIGFKKSKVEYVGYFSEGVEIKTVYSDYGFTVLPYFSNADLVPDVILDENGNVIE